MSLAVKSMEHYFFDCISVFLRCKVCMRPYSYRVYPHWSTNLLTFFPTDHPSIKVLHQQSDEKKKRSEIYTYCLWSRSECGLTELDGIYRSCTQSNVGTVDLLVIIADLHLAIPTNGNVDNCAIGNRFWLSSIFLQLFVIKLIHSINKLH